MNSDIINVFENKEVDIHILGNTLKAKVKDLPAIDNVLAELKLSKDTTDGDKELIDNFLAHSKNLQALLLKIKNTNSKLSEYNSRFDLQHPINSISISNESEKKPWKTYIIRDNDTNLVKIGKAYDIQKRIKSISSLSGRSLSLLYSFDFDIELKLHNEFSEFRTIGEWFDIPANEFINDITSVPLKIEILFLWLWI